jgi:hypothetical protein
MVTWNDIGTADEDLPESQEELLELRQSIFDFFLQAHEHIIEF